MRSPDSVISSDSLQISLLVGSKTLTRRWIAYTCLRDCLRESILIRNRGTNRRKHLNPQNAMLPLMNLTLAVLSHELERALDLVLDPHLLPGCRPIKIPIKEALAGRSVVRASMAPRQLP